MASILQIREKLLETQAALHQTKRAIAEHPNRPSLLVDLRSLENRMRSLEEQFLELSESVGEEVVSYRMFADNPDRPRQHDPSIAAVSGILAAFQGLFTLVYDAIEHGAKRTSVVSQETAELTSFNFGYAFAGSTGIVLTIPRSRQLLFDSGTVPQSAEAIMELMSAQSSTEVRTASVKFGPAVVRALRKLSDAHARHKTGAAIEWREGMKPTISGVFTAKQMRQLQTAIDETSEVSTEEVTVVGDLVGANVINKTFEIDVTEPHPDDPKKTKRRRITGKLDDAINESQTAELPKRYRADLIKTVKIVYSIEQPVESYFLVKLTGPLPEGHPLTSD